MSNDYISKYDAYFVLTEYYSHKTEMQHRNLREALNRVPPADVRPVVRGEWVREMWFRTCSKCGSTTTDKDDEGEEIPDNFCPNCGADMRPAPEPPKEADHGENLH